MGQDDYSRIDEVRVGNYAFLDMKSVDAELADLSEVALAVVTTVVSVNDTYAIVDAGSKTLPSDQGANSSRPIEANYGFALSLDHPEALIVVRVSEEHGFIEHHGHRPNTGSRIVVVPRHACPVVNLCACLVLIDDEGATVATPVDARGTP